MQLSDWIINKNVNRFEYKNRKEKTQILPWAEGVVRIISTPHHHPIKHFDRSIVELERSEKTKFEIVEKDSCIDLIMGNLKIKFDGNHLTFYNRDRIVLEEQYRKQSNVRRTIGIDEHIPIIDSSSSSLNIDPHQFIYESNTLCKAILKFEGNIDEKIYGLGGYQEERFNKNFGSYELMHRNSQTSIPFYISDQNYGFIWNNSSIGKVNFSANEIEWQANNSDIIDYFVIIGDDAKEIHQKYTNIVGKPPMIDTSLLGLWQSKLRYQNLDELKKVYNAYKSKGIQLSVLVIDYFHWTEEGNFEFDDNYWSGIEDFAKQLETEGTKLMVSLWPTVSDESKYYNVYQKNQMILKNQSFNDKVFNGAEILDFSNPLTREFTRKLLKKNYKDRGISLFWADQAEPEMNNYNHRIFDSYKGNFEKYALQYPYYYTEAVQTDSQVAKGYPLLVRSAWFNSQKYGALAWSGDIESSFSSLRRQIQIGLSMGIAGVSWWTSDIAGFHSGDSTSDEFKELIIRWFQFACFSPILRMHGDRQPHTQKIGESGGGVRTSGGPNEIWSFGEEVEEILIRFVAIREKLKSYLIEVYSESAQTGLPIMRPVFYEFPEETYDSKCISYLLGSDILVLPIVNKGVKQINYTLPGQGIWIEIFSQKQYKAGIEFALDIVIDEIPVFIKKESKYLEILIK